MTKLQELFGGELTASRVGTILDDRPDYQLTDAEYHFCQIYDVMAHDDGKAKERAEFIAEAVNEFEKLRTKLQEIEIKYTEASSDIAALFEHLPQDQNDGSYPVDGQSLHELAIVIFK